MAVREARSAGWGNEGRVGVDRTGLVLRGYLTEDAPIARMVRGIVASCII